MRIRWLPNYLSYLFKIALLLLVIFNTCRFILLSLNFNLLRDSTFHDILYALFNRGLLFDLAIISYTLAPVFLILAIGDLFKLNTKNYKRAAGLLVFVLSCVTFLLACADIPYFSYYNSRLTRTVFILSANDSIWLIIRDIFTNPLYLPYALLYIGGCVLLWFQIKKINRSYIMAESVNLKWYGKSIVFLVTGFLLFSGLRGDINPDALPLKLEHAYFCENTMTNQIGLNATFSFLDSYRDAKLEFIPDDTALAHVQNYLGIAPIFDSPIARKENDSAISTNKPNVILILVESLSASKLGGYGHAKSTMPFLDSLSKASLTYKNTYTAGMHTHNGIFSTLTGMPSILKRTPMLSSETSTKSFSGLGSTLKSFGYNNIFFMSGKKNFDNMQGFLPVNGFDELVSKQDYPKEQWINRWGVPDHCIFDYSISKLDSLSATGKPFMGMFMTISTHNPYSVPKDIDFKAKSTNAIDISYEYADWSIAKFMSAIKSKKWFSNTIVVIIGDHGQNFEPVYDIPLSYHHTPMLFYSERLIEPKLEEKLALQIDLFPTLMHLINLPYINNTLGINLRQNSRPFAFFSSDKDLGCLNEDYLLIVNPRGKEGLYRYKEKSTKNEIENHPELVHKMKDYLYSMVQTTQWMIDHKKTNPNQLVIVSKEEK